MANLYDLKKFDLNLLVIFECIYQHLSISKAAETLYITPSAVSQSLQRLRNQLNDPLFIRSVKGSRQRPSASICIIIWNKTLTSLSRPLISCTTRDEEDFVIYCPQFLTQKAFFLP
jgi:hypothetical protein